MARVSELNNAMFRAALDEAEHSLDAGEYNETVRRAAVVYSQLVAERPDMVPPTETQGVLTTAGRPGRGAERPGAGIGRPAIRPWPAICGVALRYDEDNRPQMEFAKDQFTMTDAIMCFEYTLDVAVLAERYGPS